MNTQNKSFSELMLDLKGWYDLPHLFEDFLDLVICALNRKSPLVNPGYQTAADQYYRAILKRYEQDFPALNFPQAFGALLRDMTALGSDGTGNDLLGEFYQTHLRAEPLLLSYEHCAHHARLIPPQQHGIPDGLPLRLLDPACGSGRMLLARAQQYPKATGVYGLDREPSLVKVTAINLFLAGIAKSEVVCLSRDVQPEYMIGYRVTESAIEEMAHSSDSALWSLLDPRSAALDIIYA